MSILVTGGSGFLGKALVPKLIEKGRKVYSLSRHPPEASENLVPLAGDILQPNLGLSEVPQDIHAVHHLAAIHKLGEDRDGIIWKTNVDGTRNVIDFCLKYNIPHLYFTSTAYTLGRNTYERSKALCEEMVYANPEIAKVTIFKPSIIMGTEQHFYPGHFSQFIQLVVKMHQRAEIVRRKIEGTLKLPVFEPVFRFRGNPEGTLNLVSIDAVADAMVKISDAGIFWLTNPDPPTLGQLVEWAGEFIMVKMQILPEFKPSAIEETFQRMATAFAPYLQGDNFHSDIKDHPPMTKEFINETLVKTFLS